MIRITTLNWLLTDVKKPKKVNRSWKRQHPNKIRTLWIVKSQERDNRSHSHRFVAINNQLPSGELLSNEWRAFGFGGNSLRLRKASYILIEGVAEGWARVGPSLQVYGVEYGEIKWGWSGRCGVGGTVLSDHQFMSLQQFWWIANLETREPQDLEKLMPLVHL